MFVNLSENGKHSINDTVLSPGSVLSTRMLVAALMFARPFASGRLLDVGCGSKPYRDFFGADVHFGVDYTRANKNVDCVASADALPFADKSFDTVLCSEVIEHLRYPAQAVKEMARVLKPGGHLILSAPFVHELHEPPFDFFRYTALGLVSLIEDAGLCPVLMRHRGGRAVVAFDFCMRATLTGIKMILNNVPLGALIQPWAIQLLIVYPQRSVARLALAAQRRAAKKCELTLDKVTATRLTLGFVMVAQRALEEVKTPMPDSVSRVEANVIAV